MRETQYCSYIIIFHLIDWCARGYGARCWQSGVCTAHLLYSPLQSCQSFCGFYACRKEKLMDFDPAVWVELALYMCRLFYSPHHYSTWFYLRIEYQFWVGIYVSWLTFSTSRGELYVLQFGGKMYWQIFMCFLLLLHVPYWYKHCQCLLFMAKL